MLKAEVPWNGSVRSAPGASKTVMWPSGLRTKLRRIDCWSPKRPVVAPKSLMPKTDVPRKGVPGCPYYFWSGHAKVKSIVSVVGECVSAVFKKSGVEKAHAHRFRHTLATELLGAGASFEEVADILGDSVEVIKKHYAKWSSARQARVTVLMTRVHGDGDWSSQCLT